MGTSVAGSSLEYRCLSCQAILEDRTGGAYPWLRCPQCGRAGRPPSGTVKPVPTVVTPPEDIVFLDTETGPNPPNTAPKVIWPYLPPTHQARPASPWRAAYAAALFVSLTLLLFAALERSVYGVTAFTGAAIVSLGMLIRSARS